jgi:choice-of-anchor C domain-containing protein
VSPALAAEDQTEKKESENLLVNGSFEDGPSPKFGYAWPYNPGSTAIPGWKVTRGQIDVQRGHASDGANMVDLHGSPGFGGIEQTFKTVKGHRYRVTFALVVSPGATRFVKKLGASAAGTKMVFTAESKTKSWKNLDWTTKTFEFTAVADEATLELYTLDKHDPKAGPLIDNVRVVELPPLTADVTPQSPPIELLDSIMLKCGKEIGCSGATLTIARGDQILYARSYGWADRGGKVPMQPDCAIGISACVEPFVAAAIRQLAQAGKLDLNDSVLKLLKIKPARRVVDARVWDITINHLLEYKPGWQGAPLERAWKAANGKKLPLKPQTLLPYLMCERLTCKPGTEAAGDWFTYNMLMRVVEQVSGRNFVDYMRYELCRPYGIKELKWIRDTGPRRTGEPPRVWNGLSPDEPEEYRVAVSTPAMCTFMRLFWCDGNPRDKGNPFWIMNGTWSNTRTAMIWRSDGINVAWSFNGLKDSNGDPGEALWSHAIDQLKKEGRLPN